MFHALTTIGASILAASLCLPAAVPEEGVDIRMAARVNDQVILWNDLEERVRLLEEVAGESEESRCLVLPMIVDEQLLLQRGRQLGVDEEMVYTTARATFMEKNALRDDADLAEALEISGLDQAEFRSLLIRNFVPRLVIEKEVRPREGDFKQNLEIYLVDLRSRAEVWVDPDLAGQCAIEEMP
jgi:peptidyl-prolyl cis-trans isomerase SurA